MFIDSISKYDFDTTVESLSQKISSIGWRVSHIHDLQMTLKNNGMDVLEVKVVELCNPKYAVKLLERDQTKIYSSLMPCRLSVYKTTDGLVHISRMNSGAVAKEIGGVVYEVMQMAFEEIEEILQDFKQS